MKIILDAMGGDNAPSALVEGAVLAAEAYGCDIVLVGRQEELTPLLAGRGAGRIEIVHASEVIEMEDKASTAVRQKKDSSMSVALRMLSQNEGDALVSAGSTGALLTGATLVAKRIRGIRRAALAPMLPTRSGKALLIDSGANTECTPEYLLQFAYLGHFYMKFIMGVERPRIGLVNNGTEETKGGELQQQTYQLLKQADAEGHLHFIGNVEGRDVPEGVADVLVCDGFTGNILLKSIEGTAIFLMREIKKVFMANTLTKLAALIVKPGVSKLKAMMDYKEVGGAPMLGISKPVIKAHGSCDAQAVKSAVGQAIRFVESGFIAHVEENIQYMVTDKQQKND